MNKRKSYGKIIATMLFVLVVIIASAIYTQSKKAEKNMLEEEQMFQQMEAPSLEKLQADAKNSVLEDCSNSVVGLQRIIKTDVGFDDSNPTNWWALATVEFVNKVGGIERKDVWYLFDTIKNSSGGVRGVFAHEDPARFDCDELGDADAQYKMGIRYLNGDRVWKDTSTAREYFKKSAAKGNQDAAAELAKLPPE